MSKDDRKCTCGETAGKHEAKSTATSSWRGKSLTEGSTCKRYKWAKSKAATPLIEIPEAAAPAAA